MEDCCECEGYPAARNLGISTEANLVSMILAISYHLVTTDLENKNGEAMHPRGTYLAKMGHPGGGTFGTLSSSAMGSPRSAPGAPRSKRGAASGRTASSADSAWSESAHVSYLSER